MRVDAVNQINCFDLQNNGSFSPCLAEGVVGDSDRITCNTGILSSIRQYKRVVSNFFFVVARESYSLGRG